MDDTNVIISIIIPCYNHGIYIDEAIKSVEEYKSDNYEIIIINDGSTDEFTNIRLTELKNEGYNVIFQENQGLGKTRNNAIRLAKGKYILPLDADNLISPNYIIRSINVLETNPQFSIIYSDRLCFGNSNELIRVGDFEISRIIECNYIDACAVFRKSVWETVNGYDENMPFQGLEDYDFWLSAIENNFSFFYIPEPFFLYRVVEDSMIHKLNDTSYECLSKYLHRKHSLLYVEQLNHKVSVLEKKIYNIRNSIAYRLGKLILKPFTYIRYKIK